MKPSNGGNDMLQRTNATAMGVLKITREKECLINYNTELIHCLRQCDAASRSNTQKTIDAEILNVSRLGVTLPIHFVPVFRGWIAINFDCRKKLTRHSPINSLPFRDTY